MSLRHDRDRNAVYVPIVVDSTAHMVDGRVGTGPFTSDNLNL
jgi:hypothetical protein